MGDQYERDAYRALERMQKTLLCIALGMNYGDYMNYRKIAGTVVFTGGGDPRFMGMQESITANDAEYVISYCIDTVIQIEACVSDIKAPFGSDRWY